MAASAILLGDVRATDRPLDIAVDRALVFDTQQLAAQYAMIGDRLACSILLFHEEIKARRLVRPYDLAGRRLRLLSHHPSRGPEQRGGSVAPLLAHRPVFRRRGGATAGAEAAVAEAPKLRAANSYLLKPWRELACQDATLTRGRPKRRG